MRFLATHPRRPEVHHVLGGRLLPLLVAAAACSETQMPTRVTGPSVPSEYSIAASSSAPIPVPIFAQFDDVNPCSGLVHTITVTGTAWTKELDGRLVVREQTTITTSSGFEGRGTDTFVDNGGIQKFSYDAMLANASGDRIRAHSILVVDLSAGTVQVFKITLTCVGT